jgi:long-chain acyl-CoA synthetase
LNFTGIIHRVARQFPARDAVVSDGRVESYSEFWRNISSAGQFYIDSGVVQGDRVLLVLPHCHEFLHFHFGALKVGAISAPVRYDYTGWEVRRMAANCEPRVVLSTLEWIERNRKQLELPPSTDVVPVEAIRQRMRPGIDAVLPLASARTASINYSYFGDGYPKGAMLTHGNHIYAATGYARHQGFRRDDRLLIILPMCHVYALSGCINAGLVAGAALVLSNHHLPSGILRDVERHRITILSSVPAVFECLAGYRRKDRFDLSSLRRLVTGGAFMSAARQMEFEQALGTEMVQGYGLTECLPIICNPPGAGNRRGTLGVPGRSDIAIRIAGTDGRSLPCNAVGAIQIRSRTTMTGYHRLPEDTRKLFDGEWLRTGDLGAVDEEGYLHFHGMIKPVVNLYGNKVDLGEVREAILEHPAVAAAEISAESPGPSRSCTSEVRICARLITERREPLVESEIRAFCMERLAGYKIPQLFTVDHLDSNQTATLRERGIAR